MARRYTLDTKIHALNQLDMHDGDLGNVSKELNIPTTTLSEWRRKESDLRQDHRHKLERRFMRLKAELQVQMLDRGMKIVACMDDETLEKAPLNQLATALGSLVNHALKLDEASEDSDEQTEEKIVRIEYLYGGSVHVSPPWAENDSGISSPIQNSSVRKTLGQNGTGENNLGRSSHQSRNTWLVDDSYLSNGNSDVENMEDEYAERDWYHD